MGFGIQLKINNESDYVALHLEDFEMKKLAKLDF